MNDHRRRMPLYYVGALCIATGTAIAPLGCSSTDCANASDCSTTAGAGAGGDKGSAGAAGSGGSGGVAGSAGAGGNPSDSGSSSCGGFANLPCPATMFCAYPEPMACGQGDIGGVCTPRPEMCSKDCAEVCGCDGKRYCNACAANRAGTDVQPLGNCPAPPTIP